MKGMLPTIVLLVLLSSSAAGAADWGPWEIPARQKQLATHDKSPLQQAVRLFQKFISPVDGPRCPMYPTCSTYSLQAMRKHGPLLGVFQTVDRLYREGDEAHEHGQPIEKWGFIRFSDPLSNNDFWLTDK